MLSKKQIAIMAYLYPHKRIHENTLFQELHLQQHDSSINTLIDGGFLGNTGYTKSEPHTFYLTDKGCAAYEDITSQKSERDFTHCHANINTCVAVIALIVAIISLVISINACSANQHNQSQNSAHNATTKRVADVLIKNTVSIKP